MSQQSDWGGRSRSLPTPESEHWTQESPATGEGVARKLSLHILPDRVHEVTLENCLKCRRDPRRPYPWPENDENRLEDRSLSGKRLLSGTEQMFLIQLVKNCYGPGKIGTS